ncbi:hypothetical protein [Puniceibacterium confluentis]|uniref:hypothetical protein n=1 Tax=Puniceibacterium confluentis TaxID=1958944 RepID=UPI0011B70BA6|nr:hypothetical protein [Puniceibacterium confluentis]
MTDRGESGRDAGAAPERIKSPLFLHRDSYRRRRIMDAARFLPVLGLLLWSVPLLWSAAPEGAVSSSAALTYIFGVWAILALAAFVLSLYLGRGEDEPGSGG